MDTTTFTGSRTLHNGKTCAIGRQPVSPGYTIREITNNAELVCVCAMCTCGRHHCPQHPPSLPFDGLNSHRIDYPPKKAFQPVSFSSSPWQPDPPAPSVFLETLYKHSYPGHPIGPKEPYGHPANPSPKVPFLGRTTYSTSYSPKKSVHVEPLKDVNYPAPTAVHLDGRTTFNEAYKAYAHLPGNEFIIYPEPIPAHQKPREKSTAPLQGPTSYQVDYPPYPGFRPPESFKKPQVAAASGVPFNATTQYQDIHHRMPLTKTDPSMSIRGTYQKQPDNRDFTTQATEDYVPKRIPQESLCPAARLPTAPQPSAAPQAWEGQHVLWDTKRAMWAVE